MGLPGVQLFWWATTHHSCVQPLGLAAALLDGQSPCILPESAAVFPPGDPSLRLTACSLSAGPCSPASPRAQYGKALAVSRPKLFGSSKGV